MDILVNASDPEPFGIVLLEGMARGVPSSPSTPGDPASSSSTVARACSRARASPARSPTRSNRCSGPPTCAARWARRGQERFLGTSPRSRCGGASSSASRCSRANGAGLASAHCSGAPGPSSHGRARPSRSRRALRGDHDRNRRQARDSARAGLSGQTRPLVNEITSAPAKRGASTERSSSSRIRVGDVGQRRRDVRVIRPGGSS